MTPAHEATARQDTCRAVRPAHAPPVVHPYCQHDEGEACDCAAAYVATEQRRPVTNRPRPADARAAVVQQLAAQGLTSRQIAAQLGVTQRSVERLRLRRRAT